MGAEGGILQKDIHYALGGVAVPERGDAAGLAGSREDDLGSGNDFCRICADEEICAFRNGDGAVGVLAKREAGDGF
jgi:hypothetical protein